MMRTRVMKMWILTMGMLVIDVILLPLCSKLYEEYMKYIGADFESL